MATPCPSDGLPAWDEVAHGLAAIMGVAASAARADTFLAVFVYGEGPNDKPGVLRFVGGDGPQECKDLVRRLARDLESTIEEVTGSAVTVHE